MRIYLNCNEAITDIGRELKKCATAVHTQTMQNLQIADNPDYETKEIQAFEFCIINTDDKDQMPQATLEWLNAEFKERISANFKNPGEAYKLRPEVWEQFLVEGNEFGRDDETGESYVERKKMFEYTYNERIQWQLEAVFNELKLHPESRQAIIEVHDRRIDQFKMGKERIPCSMFYQFMVRDGKLDVIYVMRSSDFATHFQNDIWLADELRRYLAKALNLPIGKFIMFVSSLHVYRKDWELLSNY